MGRKDGRVRIRACGAWSPGCRSRGASRIEGDIAEYAKLPRARGVRRLIQKHAGEPGWCLHPDFVAAVGSLPRGEVRAELRHLYLPHPGCADTIKLVRQCPDVASSWITSASPASRTASPSRGGARCANSPNSPTSSARSPAWSPRRITRPGPRSGGALCRSVSIETFGFDRVAFGGDWPVSELAARYATGSAWWTRLCRGRARRTGGSSTATTPSASIGFDRSEERAQPAPDDVRADDHHDAGKGIGERRALRCEVAGRAGAGDPATDPAKEQEGGHLPVDRGRTARSCRPW